MADYIDLKLAKRLFANDHDYGLAKRLDEVPTADVVEVVHGRWVRPTKIGHRSYNIPHCSVCNGVPCGVDEHTKYCPNCGARMDGGG